MSWGGFEQSAWLWGLVALALPIGIHLLSRGRQRRVPMGSVRWLAPAETLRARRVRLNRIALLALRCLALGLLAAWLAGPVLETHRPPEPEILALVESSILADRDVLEPDNQPAYTRLDELVANGAEVRVLARDFPQEPLPTNGESSPENPWAFVELADHQAGSEAALELFVTDRLDSFRGRRPTLDSAARWHELRDPRSNRWIERVDFRGEAPEAVVVATSSPARTIHERRPVAAGGDDELVVERSGEGWALRLVSGGAVAADDELVIGEAPRPVVVAIYAESQRLPDARLVGSALQAAADALGTELELLERAARADGPLGESADLLFWLSAAPVPEELLARTRQGALLVSDALDREEHCGCPAIGDLEGARFEKLGPVDPTSAPAVVLASEPSGRAIVDAQALGSGRWLRYASRFTLGWTDWPLRPSFSEWFLAVLGESAPPAPSARTPSSDRRSAEGSSRPAVNTGAAWDRGVRRADLEGWLWALLVAVLVFERLWATWRVA